MLRFLLLTLSLLLVGPASPQGCGEGNPNCVAPTPPPGDNSNRIATTAFVAGGTGSGLISGTTSVTAGATSCSNGQVLFNNAGVLGCSTSAVGNQAVVNITDPLFGADPTGVADSTAAIQSAIDYAFNNNINTVFCPDGFYKTTYPLFADPPNNLRGTAAVWNSGTTYNLNDIVKFNGFSWKSTAASNLNHQPGLNGPNWSNTAGRLTSIGMFFGGSGYTVNDVLTLQGGFFTTPAQITVDTVGGGGAIQTFHISNAGVYSNEILPGVIGNGVIFFTTGGTGTLAQFRDQNVQLFNFWQPIAVTTNNGGTRIDMNFTLTGPLGQVAQSGRGCRIATTFNNAPAIYWGPGNRQKFQGIWIGGCFAATNTLSDGGTCRGALQTTVVGAGTGTGGVVRLTVTSTTGFTTGDKVSVNGINGTTEANGYFTGTVVDGTHLELQGTAFVHAWVSGGVMQDHNVGYGTPFQYQKGQPTTGYCVSMTASGGASGQFMENFGCQSFFFGMNMGNSDNCGGECGLGDSNYFKNCFLFNTGFGISMSQTQNFINHVEDCSVQANTALWVVPGVSGHVRGGNYTTSNEASVASAFAISSTSALVYSNPTSTSPNVVFSTTITLPLTQPLCGYYSLVFFPGDCIDYIRSGVLDTGTINTTHFGVVPLLVTGYNASTGVITLQVHPNWAGFHFQNLNIATVTDLQTELQAATKLYLTERATTFWGTGITAQDLHIENAEVPTRFFYSAASFGGDLPSRFSRIFFNYDVNLRANMEANCGSPGAFCDTAIARYYTASQFGFIELSTGNDIEMSGLGIAQNQNDPVLIDSNNAGQVVQLNIHDSGFVRFNFRGGTAGGYNANYTNVNTPGLGIGYYDRAVSTSQATYGGGPGSVLAGETWRQFWGRSPFWGVRPVPWSMPCILPSQLLTLQGTLPAITFGSPNYNVNYPLLWGGIQYQICDYIPGTQTHVNVVSNHQFYTYGQDLTTTNVPSLSWNTKGQSAFINVNDIRLLFPGLSVKFNTDATNQYIITGVWRDAITNAISGYISVAMAPSSGGYGPVSGVKTTTYTGNTIGQQVMSFASAAAPLPLTAVTVSALPGCNAAAKGSRYIVSDATQTWTAGIGAIVAGTGGNTVPVTCDGTNWRIG